MDRQLPRTTHLITLGCLTASLAAFACARPAAGTKPVETNALARAAVAAAESGEPAGVPAAGGAVSRGVPEKIDPAAKYLFYLHGRIVETGGVRPTSPRHGVYEYEQILRTLAARGFTVVSEPRPADTAHVEYARKVVAQIGGC